MSEHSRKGNVLFIILIAVALFGALTAAVTRSTSTVSPETLSEGKAKIFASEMMQYGQELEQAVNRLITLKGCDPTQISFDDNVATVGPYDNSNSPGDYHCHVFHINGGGVSYKQPNPEWFVANPGPMGGLTGKISFLTTCVYAAGPPFTGSNCNVDIPAGPQQYADLIVTIPGIKKEICEAIAEKLSGNGTIPVDSYNAFGSTPFTGDFGVQTAHIDDTIKGTAGCFVGDGAGGANMVPAGVYAFFNTLLIR